MVLPNVGISYIPTSTTTTWRSLIPYSSSSDWLRLQSLSTSLYHHAKHVVETKMDPFFNECGYKMDELMRDHPDRHTSCMTHLAHEYGYALQSLLSRYIDIAETKPISSHDTNLDDITHAADTLMNVKTTRILRSQVCIKDEKKEIKVKKEREKVKIEKRKNKTETKKSVKRVKVEEKVETDTTDSDTDDGVDWSSMGTGSHNSILKAWLKSHWNDPYPTAAEKRQLVKATGRTYDQVQHWFINARMRIWRPALRRSSTNPDLLTKPFPQPLMIAAVKMKQEQQQANYGNKMMVTFPPLEGDGEMEIPQHVFDGNDTDAHNNAHTAVAMAVKATRASKRKSTSPSTSTSTSTRTKRKDSTSPIQPQSKRRIPRKSASFPRISISPPTFLPPSSITPTTIPVTTITPDTIHPTTTAASSTMYLPIPIKICPNSPSNKLTVLDTDTSAFLTPPFSPQMAITPTKSTTPLCIDPSTSAFTFISPPSSPSHLLTAFPLPLPLPDQAMDAGDSPASSSTSRSSMCSDASALCLSPEKDVYTSTSPTPMSLW